MIRGIDISHWNDKNVIESVQNDIDFVIIKASEGNTYADPMAPYFAEKALKMNKLLGFYHFAKPFDGSAVEQAKNFLSRIQSYVDARKCIMALDWEADALKYDTAWAKEWCDYIYNQTGIKPLIYVQESAVKTLSDVAKADYGLWVAKWLSGGTITTELNTRPNKGEWTVWAIWQYANTNGKLDCNVFNGTRSQFKKYMEG